MNDDNSGKSQFPVSEALLFALQGIRLRLGRMLLVLAGIAVSIAFTNVLFTSEVLYKSMEAKTATAAGMTQSAVFRGLWIAVALLICTAGTLNAVVMSVTERVKEIGTLKCLGSRNIHIVQIFLFESMLLGVIGGTVGGALGYGVALLSFISSVGTGYLTGQAAWSAAVYIPICIGISAGLSLLASIIPVLMAAKVEPAAAMRYEV